jgi:hypothetical protein
MMKNIENKVKAAIDAPKNAVAGKVLCAMEDTE